MSEAVILKSAESVRNVLESQPLVLTCLCCYICACSVSLEIFCSGPCNITLNRMLRVPSQCKGCQYLPTYASRVYWASEELASQVLGYKDKQPNGNGLRAITLPTNLVSYASIANFSDTLRRIDVQFISETHEKTSAIRMLVEVLLVPKSLTEIHVVC